ncbi:MAG: M28 family peptidase [Bacteroidia bacterium]
MSAKTFPHWAFAVLSLVVVFASACQSPSTENAAGSETVQAPTFVEVPGFSGDSAKEYVADQLAFGPRVPGTPAQLRCAEYLQNKLLIWADTVLRQSGKVTAFNGTELPCYNIIGSFNWNASHRIVLASHWDSRPFADQDPDNPTGAILGANDGASGVGVLLEIARNLSQQCPDWGIDIVFFDAEDYGMSQVENSFCLGSQLWAAHPHRENYRADFGVLLDMVGGKDAQFFWEDHSFSWGRQTLDHTWRLASRLGYSKHFIAQRVPPIIDDHYYVYQGTGIPMIDIIQYNSQTGFAPYWHTHDDNLDAVHAETLEAVGSTLLHLLHNPPSL